MGHITGKDVYRRLAGTIDSTPARTPDSPAFRRLLEELYTPEEADLVTRMPFRPSKLERIVKLTRLEQGYIERLLVGLCEKGLVMDLWDGDDVTYMISPLVVGIFEFTMMRTGGNLNKASKVTGEKQRVWARLLNDYMFGERSFFDANFAHGEKVSIMRALPHTEAVARGERTEILDFERAHDIVDRHKSFSVGLCSCRHEHLHLDKELCSAPLETCTSFGGGAEFLIRNGFARRIDKCEMVDILERSRDLGLVLSADNVREDVGFICHCCGCCCHLLQGIKHTGHQNILVTSNYIASCGETCTGCGLCAKACPVGAISAMPMNKTERDAYALAHPDRPSQRATIHIDQSLCIGCGVCALRCPMSHRDASGTKIKAMTLISRPARVYHPEDSFERVIMQSLERNTFQHLIFDNPNSRTEAFMRTLVGGFLRLPPVKRALMSDRLRSRFLHALRNAG
ncbi:MAG: 4Fe-4S binding protein [Pseudomonadota bacterium]